MKVRVRKVCSHRVRGHIEDGLRRFKGNFNRAKHEKVLRLGDRERVRQARRKRGSPAKSRAPHVSLFLPPSRQPLDLAGHPFAPPYRRVARARAPEPSAHWPPVCPPPRPVPPGAPLANCRRLGLARGRDAPRDSANGTREKRNFVIECPLKWVPFSCVLGLLLLPVPSFSPSASPQCAPSLSPAARVPDADKGPSIRRFFVGAAAAAAHADFA
jgi:hypothetical protein